MRHVKGSVEASVNSDSENFIYPREKLFWHVWNVMLPPTLFNMIGLVVGQCWFGEVNAWRDRIQETGDRRQDR